MKSFTLVSVVLLSLTTLATAADLPSFITACKKDDPNLADCATKEGIKILPELLKGVKSLKLPSFLPFNLPRVDMDVGDNLKITMTDVMVYGLDKYQLHKVDVDVKNLSVKLKIGFPVLNVQATYDINGQILILPIRGNGPANITYVDAEFDYYTDAALQTRKGKEYLKLKDEKVQLTQSRAYYKLDNLFNGDKRLGDEMNKFLDDNWQEINKELGPAISKLVSSVARVITSALFERVPFDQLLVK